MLAIILKEIITGLGLSFSQFLGQSFKEVLMFRPYCRLYMQDYINYKQAYAI